MKTIRADLWIGVLIISACMPYARLSAAKKLYVMDFANQDSNPDYQYLEASLTDSVRKAISDKFEILEPDRAEVSRRVRDALFIFPAEFHNANIALQVGLLTNQDIVLSGGFSRAGGGIGTDRISVNVVIVDIEHQRVVKRIQATLRLDGNIFASIDAIAGKIVYEARDILPNKGQYDFDRFAPISQTQLAVLAGANMNSVLPFLRKNMPLDTNSRVAYGGLGGPVLAAELRRDRFRGINRLIAWGRADAQFLGSDLATYVPDNGNVHVQGWAAFAEGGLGYQLWRHKRVFFLGLVGAGFFYSSITLDYSKLRFPPSDTSAVSGNLYGPSASAGLRAGLQINAYLSCEMDLRYQFTFLQGVTSANLVSTMGMGFRL